MLVVPQFRHKYCVTYSTAGYEAHLCQQALQVLNFYLTLYVQCIEQISTHLTKVNEKLTIALIIQCIGVQYPPTCFGTLKCLYQGVKHDPTEIGGQCRGKLKPS
jgi:hypothetical protein